MKKTILILLCAVLLLFSGCGGASGTGNGKDCPVKIYDEEPFSVDSVSDMELSGVNNAYQATYSHTPFYTDKDDHIIYTINALWYRFGNVSDGANAVHLMGNEPSWYEWMTKKFLWSDEEDSKERLLLMIRNCPQSANGYIWSWGSREYWLVQQVFNVDSLAEDAVSFHYDGTFRFVSAVYDVIANANSTDFLNLEDLTMVNSRDVSQGMTVREKLELAVGFIMETLGGKNGYVTLPDNMDISPPMLNYEKNFGNSGKLGSNSANYWDNYCYGHISAYENALFYEMLLKLYGLEMMCGNTEKAEEYLSLSKTAAKKYDEFFWDAYKGRYINTVDSDGGKHDYGLTFQNTEALTYGLGCIKRAKDIYSWLDGKRILDSDTSTGADIYNYTLSPRTNTVAIEAVASTDGKTWWRAPDSIAVMENGNASWGKHQTNGGFIFYSQYYDMMARLRYQGPESFMRRWDAVYSEYAKDGLIRKSGWQYGLIAEFPENGIVPISFLDGLMGISPSYRGLEIEPLFPDAYNTIGVTKYCYGGKYYGINLEKDGTLVIDAEDGIDMKLCYRPNVAKCDFTAKIYDGDGKLVRESKVSRDNDRHEIYLNLSGGLNGKLQLVIQ